MKENHLKTLHLLEQAKLEIVRLRKERDFQQGRLSMFDDMMLLFKTRPDFGNKGMMNPDLVYDIETDLFNNRELGKDTK